MKMIPFWEFVKTDIFWKCIKNQGDAKTYQLCGSHSVEALMMQKYSQSARKNNKFLVFPQIWKKQLWL